VSESFIGSEHLLRVACIGDSMMYGGGVCARETLPAQLTRFMNAAFLDQLVWVDNFGEGSGQIWNAWSQFKPRLKKMQFDAVVFSVCQNDITLLDSNDITYENPDYVKLWTEDTSITQSAIDLFTDFRNKCAEMNINPLVIFYTLVPSDRPIIDRMAEICGKLELPFADLLTFFGAKTAISPTTYIATEFDGHPSGLGHELAARGLVDMFRKVLRPSEDRIRTPPERALPAALNDLLAQGVEADAVFAWAEDALAAKRRAARRSRGREGRSISAIDEALAPKVGAIAQKWRVLRRLDARIELADHPESRLLSKLDQLLAVIRNLDELIFLLATTPDRERLAAIGRQFLNGWYTTSGRLDSFRGDVAGDVAAAREELRAMPVIRLLQSLAEENDVEPWQSISAHGRLTLASFGPEFTRLGQFAARLWAQMDILSNAWSTFSNDLQNEDIMRLWAIACQNIQASRFHFQDCETLCNKGPELDAPIANRWTSIDVVVEGGPDPAVAGVHYLLIVEAWYKVPQRMPAREAHWGGVGKDRYAYHFEIPALLVGDMRVGVADHEPTRERFLHGTTRITEIKISSGTPNEVTTPPQPAIEWHNDGQNLPYVEFKQLVLA